MSGFPVVAVRSGGQLKLIGSRVLNSTRGGGLQVWGAGSLCDAVACQFSKNYLSAVEIVGGAKGLFVSCEMRGNGKAALLWKRPGAVEFRQCVMAGSREEGVLLTDVEEQARFVDCRVVQSASFGVSLDHNARVLLQGCQISANGFQGLFVKGGSSAEVVGNVFQRNACGAIRLGMNGKAPVVIKGNRFERNRGPVIWDEFRDSGLRELAAQNKREDPVAWKKATKMLELMAGRKQFESTAAPTVADNELMDNGEEQHHPDKKQSRPNVCEFCLATRSDASFALCSKCKAVRYCSKSCQLEHWPTHKVACKRAREDASIVVTALPLSKGDAHFLMPHPHLKVHGRKTRKEADVDKKFVVKVQNAEMAWQNTSPLTVYNKRRDAVMSVVDADLFFLVRNFGMLGKNQFTSKKLFLYAELVSQEETDAAAAAAAVESKGDGKAGSGQLQQLRLFISEFAPFKDW